MTINHLSINDEEANGKLATARSDQCRVRRELNKLHVRKEEFFYFYFQSRRESEETLLESTRWQAAAVKRCSLDNLRLFAVHLAIRHRTV